MSILKLLLFSAIFFSVFMESAKTTPKYKYVNDHKEYAPVDCPPAKAVSSKTKAFRFVNSPITQDNFKTYINLGLLPKATDPSHYCCKLCGLSMYETKEKAQKKYRGNPKKENVSYTHIAEGLIEESDGVHTQPNRDGHFTLHEFEGVILTSKFKIITELK